MLRRVDRILLRVPSLPAAVKYYTQTLGMTLIRQDARLASLKLKDSDGELVLHVDPDLPADAVYYLVDDVRDLHRRRAELKLNFVSPPAAVSRGWRATVKDPFGNVLLILDHTTAGATAVEDAKPPGMLFGGVETKVATNPEALIAEYVKIGRTADDLPYTPHFDTMHKSYIANMPDPKPTRSETWRHLLNLRKAGKLPRLGEAPTSPPDLPPEDRERLKAMLGEDLGKRDRLPYTKRFDTLVDTFNKTQPRWLTPHQIWRLVSTMSKKSNK
jgi:catechol 2,3-dioxygenase-like lactoylglutathione lyase family enzyme